MQENNTTAEKTSKHAAAIEKRTELSHIDPRNIVIIGLDTDHKSVVDHAAFDPRALLPVNEDMLASIDAEGILQPIRVYATGKGEGRQYIAQAGRQRIKAARALNEKYAAAGVARRILVPVIIDAAPDEKRTFRVGIAENEIRVNNPLALKIEQAAVMATVHEETREAIARTFGVSLATISLWFKLHTAAREIKDAFKADKITFTAALKLCDLPPDTQKTTLRALLKKADTTEAHAAEPTPASEPAETARQTNETGPNAGAEGKTEGEPAKPAKAPKKASVADVQAAANGTPVCKPPTSGELKKLLVAHDNCTPGADLSATDPIALLRWITGDLQPTGNTAFEVALRKLRE